MFYGRKGGSSSFKQTPDNLRSNDTFEGVLGICAGPVKGPVRGLKSIKLDGTALENETGELNFSDFIGTIGDGDPAKFPQMVQLKLGAGASPINVGVSLTNPDTSGGTPGPWVTKTVSNTNADFLDLRFIVNQLYTQNKNGIYAGTATIEINLKPSSSTTWQNPTIGTPSGHYNEQGIVVANGLLTILPESYFDTLGTWYPDDPNYKITGKTTSPAVYELRLGVPNDGPYADVEWDVRCRLIERETYDADPNYEKRTLSWESISAVYAGALGGFEEWRGLAWLQLYGKASDQLTGVPTITGEWDTKIVSVPPSTVFNPATRQYTGNIWDGSWAKSFTNDPAWVISDAISDSLSGLSLIAPGSYLNKWDALDASKWCSTLVPDGDGGTQPRYSMNIAISDPQKAEDLIRYLAGAIGALAYDEGSGQWRLKVDKPETATDIFTLDNIEGEFSYSGTDIDTRFNDITGAYKNAAMDYREDRVRLFDNVSIATIGRKTTSIVLVGCTNRQEAMRRIKLRIRSTVNENKNVTFVTNRRGRNIEPLSTILVADGDLGDTSQRTTGRMVSISSDRKTITVRDALFLATGVNYTIKFALPNPSYQPETLDQPTNPTWRNPTLVTTRAVTNDNSNRGMTRTITLDQALPTDVDDNLNIALEATDLPTLPRAYRVLTVVPDDDGERVAISAINIDEGKWDAADNVSKSDTVFQDLRGAVPRPLEPDNGPFLSIAKVPVEQGYQTNLVVNWGRPSGAFISGFKVSYRINGGAWVVAIENTPQTTFDIVPPTGGIYDVEVATLDRRGGVSAPLSGTITIGQDILDASQIKYDDDQSLQDLKPSMPGATNTADPQAPFGPGVVQDIIDARHQIEQDIQDLKDQTNTDHTPPGVPTGLTASSVVQPDGSVTLTFNWNPNAEADFAYYNIAISIAGGDFITFVAPGNTYSIPNLTPNTAFSGKVRAVDRASNPSAYSDPYSGLLARDTTPPAPPTNFACTPSIKALNFSWTNPMDKDLAGVQIVVSPDATFANSIGFGATANAAGGTTGRLTVPATDPAVMYYWALAYDTSGNYSTPAGPLSVAPLLINTSDLAAGIVTEINLADDAVSFRALRAGAVVASKLAVTAANLNPDQQFLDPDFWLSSYVSGWDGAGAFPGPQKTYDGFYNPTDGGWYTEDGVNNPNAAPLVGASKWVTLWSDKPGMNNGARYHLYSHQGTAGIPVKANTVYEFSAGVRNGSNQNIYVQADFYDASGIYVSGPDAVNIGTSQIWAVGENGQKKLQLTTGAKAAFVRFIIFNEGFTTYSGDAEVGAVSMKEALGGTAVIDGALTANKIFMDQGFADKFFAATLTVTSDFSAKLIQSTDSLPGRLTIGSTGFRLDTTAATGAAGKNRVKYSEFNQGIVGFSRGEYGSNPPGAQGTGTSVGHRYLNMYWENTGGSIGIVSDAFDAAAGETLAYQSLVGGSNKIGNQSVNLIWLKSNGAGGFDYNGEDRTYADANVGFPTKIGGVATAPANTIAAQIRVLLDTTAQNVGVTLTMSEPMVSTAIPGQTALPTYVPGEISDPARAINSGTTTIQGGVISVAGNTPLTSFFTGPDLTEIKGGKIATNTIDATKIVIGMRGVQVLGINFVVNPDGGTFSWSQGYIDFVNDAGQREVRLIAEGGPVGRSVNSTGIMYVWWDRSNGDRGDGHGVGLNVAETDPAWILSNPNNVILARYWGGQDLQADYGRTIIDGGYIRAQSANLDYLSVSGTITTRLLGANVVTADKIGVGQLSAITANVGLLRTAFSGGRTEIEANQIRVYDSNNVLRVLLGQW